MCRWEVLLAIVYWRQQIANKKKNWRKLWFLLLFNMFIGYLSAFWQSKLTSTASTREQKKFIKMKMLHSNCFGYMNSVAFCNIWLPHAVSIVGKFISLMLLHHMDSKMKSFTITIQLLHNIHIRFEILFLFSVTLRVPVIIICDFLIKCSFGSSIHDIEHRTYRMLVWYLLLPL